MAQSYFLSFAGKGKRVENQDLDPCPLMKRIQEYDFISGTIISGPLKSSIWMWTHTQTNITLYIYIDVPGQEGGAPLLSPEAK